MAVPIPANMITGAGIGNLRVFTIPESSRSTKTSERTPFATSAVKQETVEANLEFPLILKLKVLKIVTRGIVVPLNWLFPRFNSRFAIVFRAGKDGIL